MSRTTALLWSGSCATAPGHLTLTPLELIDRIAALVPPPRTHRHRYFGVLAPNSPPRSAVTAMAMAMAAPTQQATVQAGQAGTGEVVTGVVPDGNALGCGAQLPQPEPPKRSPAHYLWAVLIARRLRPCGTDRSYAQRASPVLN